MVFSAFRRILTIFIGALGLILANVQNAFAQTVEQAWEWYKPASKIAEQISSFHDMLFVIIVAITLFVLGLLIWVMIFYNEKANPEPSKTSHNTFIEVVWTVVPILILLVIAVPSFRLLSAQYTLPKPDVVVKATGFQWYWGYQYPGKDIEFESRMLKGDDLKKAKEAGDPAPRLLAVDNPVVVPVNKVVYMYVASEDVIHNWTIPAFGAKMDAIPGSPRLTWFKAERTGVFYGQCSELCGGDHAFMPIEVRVVTDEVYKQWQEAIKDDEEKAKTILRKAYSDHLANKTKKVADNAKVNETETVK